LIGVVATSGVVDLAEGADMLAASDDIAVQSALVGSLSEADLTVSMQLASMAGRLQAVGNLTGVLGMPIVSQFLEAQSDELQGVAIEAMFRAGATRTLAAAMSATGADVAELGVNEMAEGLTRLAVAGDLAVRSDELAEAGAADFVAGVSEVAASEALDEVARDVAAEGVAEVAIGSAELGASDALDAAAQAAKDE
jgi:hypothetical protein